MRVVIFDLKFMNYIYHSTPTPTMETLLLSGYEKQEGNHPIFTDEPPNFARYNKVYIVKDEANLFHDPDWLKHECVVLIGKGWEGSEEWNDEWEEAIPDMTIYDNWIQNWLKKYPKFSENRLMPFFKKPFKIKQAGSIYYPKFNEALIIDNDLHEWDKGYETLKEIDSNKFMLLSPLVLDNKWQDALELFELRTIRRGNFWATMDLSKYSKEDIQDAINIYNEFKPGRMFRIKATDVAYTDKQWIQRLDFDYWALGEFRMQANKRLFFYPSGHSGLDIERVIKEFKRWAAKDNGYKKNSLFDYMIYDGCRNTEQMARFLHNPYKYIEEKRHGKNKFIELMPLIEKNPRIMDIITKSYPKGAC